VKILLSLCTALITGVVGLLTAGVVTSAYVDWYNVSSFEGASGYMIIGLALVGGVVSLVVGLVVALAMAATRRPFFWWSTLATCGAILGLGGAVALVLYLLADFPPTIDGEELRLEVEIRLPTGQTVPSGESGVDSVFFLASMVDHTQRASRYGTLKLDQARMENGRWIVPAEVLLFTSRGLRSIDARIGEKSIAGFIVPLPAHPGKADEQWSGWGPQPPPGSPPWPETESSYRFRVQRIPPPPPPETEEEYQARQDAAEQAVFDAIAPDASISAWLPYTMSWQKEPLRVAAIQRITGRADFAGELGALMLDADMRQAEAALRFVGELPAPDHSLIPPVTAAGQDVIERMKKVNATPEEQDPSYEGAADVMIRFSAWMTAVRALREKAGGDFIPQLQEMLELSRVRTDSRAMQGEVRRVASYYLQAWAGVAPLPGDPPPK
jgi:hypothetical protein